MAAQKVLQSFRNRLFHRLGSKIRLSSYTDQTKHGYSSEKTVGSKEDEPAYAEVEQIGIDQEEQVKKLNENVLELTKQTDELRERNSELLDKYRRSLADSENLRVRLNKQISEAKLFGIQSFCKDLLEVADTLANATASVPQDEINENNPHLKNLFEGLSMTQASLLQVFKRNGLESVNPLNEKFNPNIHEALYQREESSVEPDTVIEVTKVGYKLHDRIIRPALVGVSK